MSTPFEEKYFWAATLRRIGLLAQSDGVQAIVLAYFANRESPESSKRTALTIEDYAKDCCSALSEDSFARALKTCIRRQFLYSAKDRDHPKRRRYYPVKELLGPAPPKTGFVRFTDSYRRWLVTELIKNRTRLRGKEFSVFLHAALRAQWEGTSAQELKWRELGELISIKPAQYRAAERSLTKRGLLSSSLRLSPVFPEEQAQHDFMTPRRSKALNTALSDAVLRPGADGELDMSERTWLPKEEAKLVKKQATKQSPVARILEERHENHLRAEEYRNRFDDLDEL